MDKKAVIQMVCCMTIQPGNKERMIRMKKRLLIGLTVLGIVFIAGCSGNSGTTGTAQNSASSGTASGGTEAVTPQVILTQLSAMRQAPGRDRAAHRMI